MRRILFLLYLCFILLIGHTAIAQNLNQLSIEDEQSVVMLKLENDILKLQDTIANLQKKITIIKSESNSKIHDFRDYLMGLEVSIGKIQNDVKKLETKVVNQNRQQVESDQLLGQYKKTNDLLVKLIAASNVKIKKLIMEDNRLAALNKSNKYQIDQNKIITENNNSAIKSNAQKISQNKTITENNSSIIKSNTQKSDQIDKYTQNEFLNINSLISSRTLYLIILIVILAILSVFIFIFLKKKLTANKNSVFDEIGKTRKNIDKEYINLDIKLVELLEKQFKVLEHTEINTDSTIETLDHSLPLKVAAEIHRMRKRVDHMPKDTQGIKPLLKALGRLEDELVEKDYELVELLGKPYDEGMTVTARFIPDEELNTNEQIISKIIKPQVNYNGKLIQVADIEVSIGGE